jgi:hypothetical protein
MTEERVRINADCALVVDLWDGHYPSQAYIEYTEYASDHWGSDRQTDADIDEDTARAMIAALHKAFPALASATP